MYNVNLTVLQCDAMLPKLMDSCICQRVFCDKLEDKKTSKKGSLKPCYSVFSRFLLKGTRLYIMDRLLGLGETGLSHIFCLYNVVGTFLMQALSYAPLVSV